MERRTRPPGSVPLLSKRALASAASPCLQGEPIPMTNDIPHAVAAYNRLKAELMDLEGLEPDDRCLAHTLEGATDLQELIAGIVREAGAAQAMAKGLAELIDLNIKRKQRLEHRNETLRKIALRAMEETGLLKITAPDMTITVSQGRPTLMVTDEAAVPDELCKITRTPKKKEIGEFLASGEFEFITYAMWSDPQPILTVRRK